MYHQREWLIHFPSVGMSDHRKTIEKKIVSDFGHFSEARCNSAGSLFQNKFLNPPAEVGMGGHFSPAFTHCPLQFHRRLNIGSYCDMSYICLRGVQVVPARFSISLSTFLFLTSDISGSCWHLIFKRKWLSAMKAVPLQPFRHRWHLSLVFRESALFFVKMKPWWTNMTEPLLFPSIFSKFGIATWRTHEKFTQIPNFQG